MVERASSAEPEIPEKDRPVISEDMVTGDLLSRWMGKKADHSDSYVNPIHFHISKRVKGNIVFFMRVHQYEHIGHVRYGCHQPHRMRGLGNHGQTGLNRD
jgi:hypothetical protein